MKYLFVAKSEDDPATRYRVQPIVELLRARNDDVELVYEPGSLAQFGLMSKAAARDLVFVQRKLLRPLVVFFLSRVTSNLVFDHDDAIFLKSSGQPSSTRSRRYGAVVRAAQLVLSGNKYLSETVQAYGGNAAVIPTAVDMERYERFDRDGGQADPLTLVWIGSRSTSRYLEQHRRMFEALAMRLPDLRLRIIGDFEFSVSGMDVECVPWTEEGEASALAAADIGIAPMTDDPWTRGKCALKIIQYMAAGLPVVSSDVGANSEVVRHDETGYLVDSTEAWCDAITRLADSAALRTSMGSAGRQVAEAEYSQRLIAARVVTMLDALTSD